LLTTLTLGRRAHQLRELISLCAEKRGVLGKERESLRSRRKREKSVFYFGCSPKELTFSLREDWEITVEGKGERGGSQQHIEREGVSL